MDAEQGGCLPTDDTDLEYRVKVTSKKDVTEQLNKYKKILETVFDGQPDVEEQIKRVLLQELLANFEAAVLDNVLVNGQRWEDAADAEAEEATDLDVLLDDTIVEAAWKRRVYPKRILPHVVHSLKAERKLLELYQNTVNPQEVVKNPDQENTMRDVSAAAPQLVKEAIQVMKSIPTVQRQAEGLCQILSTKPSHTTLEIHQDVFAHSGQADACLLPVGRGQWSQRPIRRAVQEEAATGGYVPPIKKPVS
ncbi:kinetochore-associated protein NSL1 homolog isoform X1 [Takifugu rubripes]|uniref:kinetochore-associated protein NSL1 homolog isoform X1 n=1 Tax=Takifugu rubripes TaxID=31033 RepID=UPI0011455DB4|nr:kinetochore-associated protein NSL1 homolog isoform X1 [Takifugu rubripes]